ncbi:MAG: 2Fe-2S iron-sulfur cluster-binding protein [Lautropia sp.]
MPKVTFLLPDGGERTVEIQSGLTVMEGARDQGLDGIVAECGGGLICATCHVQVESEWFETVGPAEGTEAMLLEMVPEMTRTSRLSCQIAVSDELDGLRVRIPSEQLGTSI